MLVDEIKRRRTFGIISHPDAGKTTLTEKLLLFGGAIQTAGAVKAKRAQRHASSDFMEIEKQRGISVATSVMGFEYEGYQVNILDTPGHEDFCEDTYRTLTAVDSVIMVIDAAKGVEAQTHKLLEVCRMRNTPVMTFFNKCDREGRDPIELLDELESQLKIPVCPITWPIGLGSSFKGVYHLDAKDTVLMEAHGKAERAGREALGIEDAALNEKVGDWAANKLRDDVELLEGVYSGFNEADYLSGSVTPVFFGSALNNFGVQELLQFFLEHAPFPKPRPSSAGDQEPTSNKFSGFIFKIHANLDPKHRDRIAFMRVCSGQFERQKKYHHVRLDKVYRTNNPTAFMAQQQHVIDVAYPGDIVGLHDTGQLQIGDTLTEGASFQYLGIPNFSPELFNIVVNKDPMKTKQLRKGLSQLCDEGVAQLFHRPYDGQFIVGVLGALQFDVIQYRLAHEYGASCDFRQLDYAKAVWVNSEDPAAFEKFRSEQSKGIVKDQQNRWVYLAETDWRLNRDIQDYPDINFEFTAERVVG